MISEILSKWINNQFTPDKKDLDLSTLHPLLDTVKVLHGKSNLERRFEKLVYKFDEFGNTIAGDSYYLTTEEVAVS
ncbi:hypothetical protein MASR2M39_24750 [Ignavibacteriales bacterium]